MVMLTIKYSYKYYKLAILLHKSQLYTFSIPNLIIQFVFRLTKIFSAIYYNQIIFFLVVYVDITILYNLYVKFINLFYEFGYS